MQLRKTAGAVPVGRRRNTGPAMNPRRVSVERALLVLILVGAAANNLAMSRFTIEDAAIDFAYAKNLVAGEGPVPFPGGEWVEGWSNPTWLALLTLTTALGADPFFASHALGLVLSLGAVLVVWRIGRRLAPPDSGIALLGPAFLAANTPFGLWGTAGLENALWSLLFAVGIERSLAELDEDVPRARWLSGAAVAWLLIALTRPEGLMYAVAAGVFYGGIGVVRQRSARPAARWLATFAAPWTAYQVWHYLAFAWPLPNTYYGKLERHALHPMDWSRTAWAWTRSFFLDYGQGVYLPVWLVGALGHRGWRLGAVTAAFALVGLSTQLSDAQRLLVPAVAGLAGLVAVCLGPTHAGRIGRGAVLGVIGAGAVVSVLVEVLRAFGQPPNPVPVPGVVDVAPPWVLAGVGVAVTGLAAAGARESLLAATRAWVWALCMLVIVFAVVSEGDWMAGYRWYALGAVPASILFALGAHGVAELFEALVGERRADGLGLSRVGVGMAVALVLAQVPTNVQRMRELAADPDPSPHMTLHSVRKTQAIRDRVHWDEPIEVVGVDMGSMLLWGDFRVIDLAGLVDVPVARNHWPQDFVRQYLFEEHRPFVLDVGSAGGLWEGRAGLAPIAAYREYVEVAPGWDLRLRRDVLLRHRPADGPGPVRFARGISVYAPQVPVPTATGGRLYVEIGMAAAPAAPGFRVLLYATDGAHTRAWDLPPAYDWLPSQAWRTEEMFDGRFALPVGDLPPGAYTLGVVVLLDDGSVAVPAGDLPGGAWRPGRDQAAVAVGEVRFAEPIDVLSAADQARASAAAVDLALATASTGPCDAAERAWSDARHLREGDDAWAEGHVDAVSAALGACWVRAAEPGPGVSADARVQRLLRAQRWDHRADDVLAATRAHAAELYAEGLAARAAGDAALAYRRFSDAVALDGRLTWARRYAEELRAAAR